MNPRKSLEHVIRNSLEGRSAVQYVGRPNGGDGDTLGRQAAVLSSVLNIDETAAAAMQLGRLEITDRRHNRSPTVTRDQHGNIVHIFYPDPVPSAAPAVGGKSLEEEFGGFKIHPEHIINYALENTDSLIAKGQFAHPHELADGANIALTAAQLANSTDRHLRGTSQLVNHLLDTAQVLRHRAAYLSHTAPDYIQGT